VFDEFGSQSAEQQHLPAASSPSSRSSPASLEEIASLKKRVRELEVSNINANEEVKMYRKQYLKIQEDGKKLYMTWQAQTHSLEELQQRHRKMAAEYEKCMMDLKQSQDELGTEKKRFKEQGHVLQKHMDSVRQMKADFVQLEQKLADATQTIETMTAQQSKLSLAEVEEYKIKAEQYEAAFQRQVQRTRAYEGQVERLLALVESMEETQDNTEEAHDTLGRVVDRMQTVTKECIEREQEFEATLMEQDERIVKLEEMLSRTINVPTTSSATVDEEGSMVAHRMDVGTSTETVFFASEDMSSKTNNDAQDALQTMQLHAEEKLQTFAMASSLVSEIVLRSVTDIMQGEFDACDAKSQASIADLSTQLSQTKRQLAVTVAQRDEVAEKLDFLESERDVKNDFVSELQADLRSQEARYMELERMAAESVELYESEKKKMCMELETLLMKQSEMRSAMMNATMERDQLAEQCTEIQFKAENEVSQMREKCDAMRTDLANVRNKCLELGNANKALRDQCGRDREEMDELKRRTDKYRMQAEERLASLTDQLQRAERNVVRIRQMLGSVQRAFDEDIRSTSRTRLDAQTAWPRLAHIMQEIDDIDE
jgi:chromosome segregation ATPase